MIYTYEQAVTNLEEFEKILRKFDIKINNDSYLEEISLNVVHMYEKFRNSIIPDEIIEFREYYRTALGLNDIIFKLIRNKDHPELFKIVSYLKMLNHTSFVQNNSASQESYKVNQKFDSNKMFEFVIALNILSFSDNILIEDPLSYDKSNRNPDVITYYLGDKWGIACKVLATKNNLIKNIKDHIIKGFQQIQISGEESGVTKGVTIINLKNVIDHESIWPITNQSEIDRLGAEPLYKCYFNENEPLEILKNYSDEIGKGLKEEFRYMNLKEQFGSKISLPGFILFLQSAAGVLHNGKKAPVSLGIFSYTPLVNYRFSEKENSFLQNLNLSMHNE